ncbi:MAG TPA: class I SAM-dependent methyltransferase [Gaiellaceae bacterium]|nr:class I SAM-dependent methyltransferase [Gaiellaceae bacterium]
MKREDWNRKHADGEHHFGGAPNRFFVAEAAELAPGRALDLACGAGRNAVWLAEQGWSVLGVDFSEVGLASARALAAERGVEVEWVEADVRDWVPAPASFDLVAVLYLHLPADERRPVLERAAAAAAPGGTVVVVGHDLQNLNGGHGGPQDARVLFTPDDVVAELPGLEVEKAERVLRPVQTEGGEAHAIDAFVRARRPA